jgi:hypothetical protein
MQASNLRYFVLIGVLLAAAGLYAALGEPRGFGTPRWPSSDALYSVPGWSAGPEQNADGGFKTRALRNDAGQTATLAILSNQAPKLYAAGAEVPFLGNGYSVEPAPADLQPLNTNGAHALVATRGADQWLVIYAYGERRGLLGNGPVAWGFALFDGVMGRPNDYYRVFLSAHGTNLDPSLASQLSRLASTLFPRIAQFYAAA